MKQGFSKKIYTAKLLLSDLGFLIRNLPNIIGVFRNSRINRAFIEKIMTVTTAVNGCVYCAWFHAKQAVQSGISEAEVKNLMNLQFQTNTEEFELPALLYAQHFAETDRKPDSEMTERLFGYYGETTAKHIILVIRMIFFGNLYGNTWDAVISRFRGRPAPNSYIVFELFFFLMNAIFMIPTMMVMKLDKKAVAAHQDA